MHTELHHRYKDTAEGKQAQEIINACVHCGFCLATCPTYLDSRDERDSPRGRIYLIKELLETGSATQQTHTHLDRCLTCRSCETTCPSGVSYGRLADIGRGLMEEAVARPATERMLRYAIRKVLSSPPLFAFSLRCGQIFRPILPARLQAKIRPRSTKLAAPVSLIHPRTMLILAGCAQKSATPETQSAATAVLDRLGITLNSIAAAGCCGAVNYHLSAHEDGLDDMRRNIDAWWPSIETGAEAIVSSASGCGAMLVDYGSLLAHDPNYASKAQRVSELTADIAEILLGEDLSSLEINTRVGKVAIHTPCTLQHALKLPDAITQILATLGFDLVKTTEDHLCCGSAGTYSLLQPAISHRLLDRKLDALTIGNPDIIVTGNVGCQLHIGGQATIPTVHWIELLDGIDNR
jgi:glycolate oxidase iron-sulfur subunit